MIKDQPLSDAVDTAETNALARWLEDAMHAQDVRVVRYERLPGATYAQGFVRAYAEHLNLDGAELVRRYKAETAGLEADPGVGSAVARGHSIVAGFAAATTRPSALVMDGLSVNATTQVFTTICAASPRRSQRGRPPPSGQRVAGRPTTPRRGVLT